MNFKKMLMGFFLTGFTLSCMNFVKAMEQHSEMRYCSVCFDELLNENVFECQNCASPIHERCVETLDNEYEWICPRCQKSFLKEEKQQEQMSKGLAREQDFYATISQKFGEAKEACTGVLGNIKNSLENGIRDFIRQRNMERWNRAKDRRAKEEAEKRNDIKSVGPQTRKEIIKYTKERNKGFLFDLFNEIRQPCELKRETAEKIKNMFEEYENSLEGNLKIDIEDFLIGWVNE